MFFKRWKGFDRFPGLPFGCTKFIEALEVKPELCVGSEEVGKAQRRVPGYDALAVDNSRDAIGGHFDLRSFRSLIRNPQSAITLPPISHPSS